MKRRFPHSINSSKIPTMLENSTKPSLGDGSKREDEKRKRKALRCLQSNAYFSLEYALVVSKREKADFLLESVFLLIDFSRGDLGRVRLAIKGRFSKIVGEVRNDFVFPLGIINTCLYLYVGWKIEIFRFYMIYN